MKGENMERSVHRVVITGPTGAIGMALIQRCVEEGIQVLAIARKGSERLGRIPVSSLVRTVECSLDELALLDETALRNMWAAPFREQIGGEASCCAGTLDYDVFFHLAWAATIGGGRNDMKLQTANISCALDAVALADRLGCHTFVGAGSQAEYGRSSRKLNAETPTFPENGYGMAKLCAGQMTRMECHSRGIRHIWARILSVYGPGDGEGTMISTMIRRLLAGEKPALTAGEQLWDYLYSADAAGALFLLGKRGRDGAVYCVGSGQARPLREYMETLRDSIDGSLPLGIGEVPYAENQVMYLCADISALTEDTGFMPRIGFSEGIVETVRWYRER